MLVCRADTWQHLCQHKAAQPCPLPHMCVGMCAYVYVRVCRADAWQQLCQDEAAQSRLLDFASVFEHLKQQPGWRCSHEVMEAYCQISAGGTGDPSTTFGQFVQSCMREPAAYTLMVANHCTGRGMEGTCLCLKVHACAAGGWGQGGALLHAPAVVAQGAGWRLAVCIGGGGARSRVVPCCVHPQRWRPARIAPTWSA